MVNSFRTFVLFAALLAFGVQGWAQGGLRVQKVTQDIYALVGDLGNRSPENLGNNATFGLVVTDEGAVLIDSGGSYAGAQAIAVAIKTVTDQPVVKVINTGGQDHRWLGNDYFKRQGAEIIAGAAAVEDQQARTQDQLIVLNNLVGEELMASTNPVYAETRFEDEYAFTLGGKEFAIHHKGQAHTPGDSFVWLPGEKTLFSGDIVYVERMLGVGGQSNSKSWLEAYQAMAAFEPRHLIPGHGPATTLARGNKDTRDYLRFLRRSIGAFIDNGGNVADISSVDQSSFSYLLNFDSLAGRNAQQVFFEMEWE